MVLLALSLLVMALLVLYGEGLRRRGCGAGAVAQGRRRRDGGGGAEAAADSASQKQDILVPAPWICVANISVAPPPCERRPRASAASATRELRRDGMWPLARPRAHVPEGLHDHLFYAESEERTS